MKKENERYQSLLQERYSQADDVHSKMGKLQKELIDLQASQVPLQFDKEKLASEKEALLKHNKWLDEELQSKSSELRSLKQIQAQQIAGVQSELDEAVARASAAEETVTRLRGQLSSKDTKLEELAAELRDERTRGAAATANFEGQLGAERKSTALSEELKQMAELALAEREKDMKELRTTMEELEAKYVAEREELGREIESRKQEALNTLEQKQQQVQELTEELEKCRSELLRSSAAASSSSMPRT